MKNIIVASLIMYITVIGLFVSFEPVISQAVQDQFEVSQVITDEITFHTTATDVSLSPALSGITGGTSNGGTQVIVRTNNSTGYTMTLTASSSAGMLGDSQGGTIPALSVSSPTVPDYSFDSGTVGANLAYFAYSVEASTTADLDPSFKDNGSNTCNTGSTDTVDKCWLNASTTAETIINRSTATEASGATSTLKFRVVIKQNPSPSLAEDTYTATTTLTATNN